MIKPGVSRTICAQQRLRLRQNIDPTTKFHIDTINMSSQRFTLNILPRATICDSYKKTATGI